LIKVKFDVDYKLFIAIHDDQLCQWYIIGLDGTIGEHIKVYAELRAYYTLIAKSEDLKLTIEK
jgi:hypothetical protein